MLDVRIFNMGRNLIEQPRTQAIPKVITENGDEQPLTEEIIRERLEDPVDQIWLERAVIALFQMQTADEQAMNATTKQNGIGFNGADAPSGCYMAKWLLADKTRHLSGKFLVKARKMMPKYSRQLLAIAEAKAMREGRPVSC